MTLDGAKVALAVAALVAIMTAQATSDEGSDNLAAPESFAAISDSAARSAALFMEAAKVLTHPRCVNCHPAGDRPRQGDIRRLHQPPVARGEDGFGLPAMRCPICHQGQFRTRRSAGQSWLASGAARDELGGQDGRTDL